jgi:hypothetical protein
MNIFLKPVFCAGCVLVMSTVVLAKLPALSDAAKAKEVEASAKAGWSVKVDGFLLCKSQDKVAAHYLKSAKAAGKDPQTLPTMPPCSDPGAFPYMPSGTAAPAPALPASAATPAKKS